MQIVQTIVFVDITRRSVEQHKEMKLLGITVLVVFFNLELLQDGFIKDYLLLNLAKKLFSRA